MNIRIIGKEDFISKYVKNNGILYIVLMIIFLLGIIIGTLYYKQVVTNEELSSYLEENFSKLQEEPNEDVLGILKDTMTKNIWIAVIFWLLGASVIGIPILLFYISYKGFTLGFTIATVLATYGVTKGNLINFVMLFFQNIVFIPMMMVAMVSAIRFAINLLKRKKDIKIEILRHTIVCVFCAIGLLISAGIEIFFNSYMLKFVLF